MTNVRITSAQSPFDSRRLATTAVGLIAMADAMGLLEDLEIERLDLETFRQIVDRISKAGIGTEVQAALRAPASGDDELDLDELLRRLSVAIEESPSPKYEWPALERLFGVERLASLLNTSPASVRRYGSGARTTPDDIAGRLHFLATVVGELAGAYNDFGIRRWFDRKRTLLEGVSPAELLTGDWDADDAAAQSVRALARSLNASAAA